MISKGQTHQLGSMRRRKKEKNRKERKKVEIREHEAE